MTTQTKSKPLLAVQDLHTHFHTFAGTVKAVNGVSFEVGAGEVMGLVGESGGGKSVVGFSILGLIDSPGKIEGGQILLDGQDLVSAGENRLRQVRGREISMVFQDPLMSLNPVYRVGWQIAEALIAHKGLSRAAAMDEAVQMLDAVGVPDARRRARAYPHQLSGGQQQRVAIARVLMQKAEIILADEPIASLDPESARKVMDILKDINERDGKTVIVTLHQVEYARKYCGRAVALKNGELYFDGESAALSDERLANIYGATSMAIDCQKTPKNLRLMEIHFYLL